VDRAEQIRQRLAQIDEELGADPPEVGPSNADAFLTWIMESMPAEQRTALMEERRQLLQEYNRLPERLKGDDL
jgi:hypothetical protein